jgi:hypothetical protein
MDCWDTAILPLHLAAEEAWMSIMVVQRTRFASEIAGILETAFVLNALSLLIARR